ncbi:zinc-ribbon domain-containing protein [Pseudaestuariivita sp.]|uniref:zinc-ribbon domain-containing protein n=1 Tax=Pseudaestuariivita sp. TaxID=2211669 RepID=UPI00405A4B2B
MRLVCPNCGAQYEVPDGVIPKTGRDVQCSNCSNTWFEPHPSMKAQAGEDEDHVSASPPPAPQPQPQPTPQPQPQPVDPAVADVLRQEAEFEARARAAETTADPIESQPDLGLVEAADDAEQARRVSETQAQMAHVRGGAEAAAGVAAAGAATAAVTNTAEDRPRREQLPDIDDINASLRSSKEPRLADRSDPPPHMAAEADRRRNFRRGFALAVLVGAMIVALYVFAPRISEQVPALSAPLMAFVEGIDQGRLWLDGQVDRTLAWLDSMASEASGPAAESTPSE